MCSPAKVVCFHCMKEFDKAEADDRCPKCGDWKCPHCGACLCTLTPSERRVAIAMMMTYEGALGTDYDPRRAHAELEIYLPVPDKVIRAKSL